MLRYLFLCLHSVFLSVVIFPVILSAKENKCIDYRSDCTLPLAQINLEINNVRARLSSAGVMWRNSSHAGYAVPKVNDSKIKNEVHALNAGAFWLSGLDEYNNLKVAANTYRSQTSIDFWPGPIDEWNGTANAESCQNWDKFFEVKGDEIRIFRYRFQERFNSGSPISIADISHAVLAWPGNGNPHFAAIHGFEIDDSGTAFAPYFDFNGDGIYDPLSGDFPVLDFGPCGNQVYADQMIYSVFNDVGNIHTSSRGYPIGAEVHLMDYAFSSDDVLNDVTFKKYKFILRSNEIMSTTYASLWLDADLGCYNDDYLGCDSTRSLMFVYNSDEMDGADDGCFGFPAYGNDIPMLGIDFLAGPNSDNPDNPMTSFMAISNASFDTNNDGLPTYPMFRVASGVWTDGTPVTKGGTGYNISATDITKFMFSGRPDISMEWSMCQIQTDNMDYRAVMSSGPFSWQPGEIKVLDAGIVYVPSVNYPCPDIEPLLRADVEMQAAFNACFILESEGPVAPFAKLKSANKQLILNWSYDSIPGYEDKLRIPIQGSDVFPDERYYYKWEGIKIFQLKDANVSRAQLNDTTYSKLVFQCDLENGIDSIFNWKKIENTPDYLAELMVVGEDEGLLNEIMISTDLFDQNKPLKRRKDYHFAIIAYSYNSYNPNDPDKVGQDRKSYIESAVYKYLKGRISSFIEDDEINDQVPVRDPLSAENVISNRGLECPAELVVIKVFDFTGRVLYTINDQNFSFSGDAALENKSWLIIYKKMAESGMRGNCFIEIKGAGGERRVRKIFVL